MTTLQESDLVTITAKITSIIQDKYHHYKYTDDRITIHLDNSPEAFYFFDNRANFFQTIVNNLHVGDIVTLWHRTKIQSRFGTGSEFKIMKVLKEMNVIYGFDKAKETFAEVGSFTTFAAIGLWLVYFFLLHKIKRQRGNT